jgi:hypothetical protein
MMSVEPTLIRGEETTRRKAMSSQYTQRQAASQQQTDTERTLVAGETAGTGISWAESLPEEVTETLFDAMREHGLVVFEATPDDPQRSRVRLTGEGRNLLMHLREDSYAETVETAEVRDTLGRRLSEYLVGAG